MNLPFAKEPSGRVREDHGNLKHLLSRMLCACRDTRNLLDANELDAAAAHADSARELAVEYGRVLAGAAEHLAGKPGSILGRLAGEGLPLSRRVVEVEGNPRLDVPEALFSLQKWAERCHRLWMRESGYRVFRLRSVAASLGLAMAVAVCGLGVFRIFTHFENERLMEARSRFEVDLVRPAEPLPAQIRIGGMLGPERDGRGSWRWGTGPQTLIAFVLEKPRPVSVVLEACNPIPSQVLRIDGNGKKLVVPIPDAHAWLEKSAGVSFTFDGVKGLNVLSISYDAWNLHGAAFAPDDPAPYAVAYTRMVISTLDPERGR